MLRNIGYEVITAKNGKHATEIFSSMPEKIDLVILDMIMPVMGGGDVYNILKQIKPDVKVILSSGYSSDSEAAEILSIGCNSFIQKPFDMIELSLKVREILDSNKKAL
jgi:two-component system cell cycle sensor histidine kinase/response regulator CckA